MPRDEHEVNERSQAMTPSSIMPLGEPPLSPHRAFVVQFRTGPAPVAGRVEHVTSGHATRFQSAQELWDFMTQIVGEGREESL